VPPTHVEDPYEWESTKDRANQRKHGVSFAEASTTLAHRDAKVFGAAPIRGQSDYAASYSRIFFPSMNFISNSTGLA
jgi:hypothetical protein